MWTCSRVLLRSALPAAASAVRRQCLHSSASVASSFKPGRGTGDKGTSGLYTNERRPKHDAVFGALGDLDELSCRLAVCQVRLRLAGLADIAQLLVKVQCCLQDVASNVATPPPPADSQAAGARALQSKFDRTKFEPKLTEELNSFIDVYAEKLPPLTQFILPGGGVIGSELHVCRAVCRRAERSLSRLVDQVDPAAYKYVNRLSDLLFVLARRTAQLQSQPELAYTKPQALADYAEHVVRASKL